MINVKICKRDKFSYPALPYSPAHSPANQPPRAELRNLTRNLIWHKKAYSLRDSVQKVRILLKNLLRVTIAQIVLKHS